MCLLCLYECEGKMHKLKSEAKGQRWIINEANWPQKTGWVMDQACRLRHGRHFEVRRKYVDINLRLNIAK